MLPAIAAAFPPVPAIPRSTLTESPATGMWETLRKTRCCIRTAARKLLPMTAPRWTISYITTPRLLRKVLGKKSISPGRSRNGSTERQIMVSCCGASICPPPETDWRDFTTAIMVWKTVILSMCFCIGIPMAWRIIGAITAIPWESPAMVTLMISTAIWCFSTTTLPPSAT